MSPQSVELVLRRSPLRLLVSQLPLILLSEEQLASPEKDVASFPCAALPKSPSEPSRQLAYQHLKLHTWQDRPRRSSRFLHPLEASGSYDKERPYLSRFHSNCFLELALAQKKAVFFVLLIFLDPRPGKCLGWHRDFLLLALGAVAGKRGALQISPGEELACTLPDPWENA